MKEGTVLHKSYDEIKRARMEKSNLDPEVKAKLELSHEYYSTGFGDANEFWWEELAESSFWHLLFLRRHARRRMKESEETWVSARSK